MGDEVNFASRLEGLTKYYKVQCLISESVQKEIKDDPAFLTRQLDSVIVKGKTKPKTIFELVTRPIDESSKRGLVLFERGRLYYMNGDWDEAMLAFREAIVVSHDGPSQTFLERCEELKANPPAAWNGVYEFTSK